MITITNVEFIQARDYSAYEMLGNYLVPVNPHQEGTPEYSTFQIFRQCWPINKEGNWPEGEIFDRAHVKLDEKPVTWRYASGLVVEDAIPIAIYVN